MYTRILTYIYHWVKQVNRKRCLLVLVVVAFLLILRPLSIYRSKVSRIGFTFKVYHEVPPGKAFKTIAMGSPMFGAAMERYTNLEETGKGNLCKYIDNYDISDAVVFHGPEMLYYNPVTRPAGQVWAVILDESPANIQMFPFLVDGKINLTMGYMRHSDIPITYGTSRILTRKERLALPDAKNMDFAKGKTSLGVARISQCQSGRAILSGRVQYLKNLKDYVPIDLFGFCFRGSKCEINECGKEIMGYKYKFYFAFENSMCKDYITEKFWHISFNYNMVPVVQGGLSKKDYQEMAPPKSFIHVDDFSSPKHLADYLKYLDGNDTAYNEFHDWRRTHKVYYPNGFEHLCDKLHDASWSQTIQDFNDVYGLKFCRFPPAFKSASFLSSFTYYFQSHNIDISQPFS